MTIELNGAEYETLVCALNNYINLCDDRSNIQNDSGINTRYKASYAKAAADARTLLSKAERLECLI